VDWEVVEVMDVAPAFGLMCGLEAVEDLLTLVLTGLEASRGLLA
jgi:hypothetical protein